MDEQNITGLEDDIEEYLVFTVDKIDFGIDIGLVQEIIEIQPASPIPNGLDFCSGIINIRGMIVPVLDMRRKLGFQPVEYDDRACIIVILLEAELVGAIVDSVQDVIHISARDLLDSPAISGGEQAYYTSKIASIDGKIRQILNVNAVFDIGNDD
ncbi:purine-binding chemotaxis protein CheW [Sporobacter termitidis DSM 10068]|uniref:Chemotaxis protein CheW n=1 Tax=Sporobacter termitidis DSM 10068 TaxID=1123282 RepID=A0A1M5W9W3_9FIRM|nr:chemotaxis protein CheW [Sporobacter termitidis]SHH83984.1 purine-binding chemotaxis protein CheW [Sporobacter termitidis DSM 10068]